MILEGRYVPHVEEDYAKENIASLVISTLISALPTIHAKRIDVIVNTLVNDVSVDLIVYGPGTLPTLTTTLGIVTAAAGSGSFVYTGAIGDLADLVFTNNNGA